MFFPAQRRRLFVSFPLWAGIAEPVFAGWLVWPGPLHAERQGLDLGGGLFLIPYPGGMSGSGLLKQICV